MWNDFFIQLGSNIAGSLFIAILLFLFSDYLFKVSPIEGHWKFKTTTLKSSYNPYINMILMYKVLIWVEGKNIHGSAEKIFEDCNGNKREYNGENRNQCKITGYIQKGYFTKDKIIIHIDEIGNKRNSSTIHLLKRKGNFIEGRFISTIADSEGIVSWEKQ